MTISPFVAGVLVTLFIEMALVIALAAISTLKGKRK